MLYAFSYKGLIFKILSDYSGISFQYIETDKDKTGKLQINNGVPQRLILSPLIFLVYVKDLPRCTEIASTIGTFAGDLFIAKVGGLIQCNLQTHLDQKTSWFLKTNSR